MTAGDASPHRFHTTRWTLVLAAGHRRTPEAEAALATLCEVYWPPVYAFIRRSGHEPDAARDLTQAFFARVLEKNFFGDARRERGRFRTFLLTAVRNFLANQHDWDAAKKRGGGRAPIALEHDDGERTYRIEPVEHITPERLFERRWALTVIGAAMSRVRATYQQGGKMHLFEQLRPYLTGAEPASYADLAVAMQVTEGSLRVAVHRLRRQFAEALRGIIAETVETPAEVDEELQFLLAAVSG
jgi:RNA polymerase sigma-70 factor (ECF subfamily)